MVKRGEFRNLTEDVPGEPDTFSRAFTLFIKGEKKMLL